MKTDIAVPEVQDVIVAIVPRSEDLTEELWDVYVINVRDEAMDNVLITSQGYGSIDGNNMSTTVLRHFHQHLAAGAAIKVEPIQTSLFNLKNEYWLSFNAAEGMLDKRFVFKPGSISTQALETVPILNRPGVMMR